MLNKLTQLATLGLIVATPFVLVDASYGIGTVQADAIDDPGPCPNGTTEVMPMDGDYRDDTWYDANGDVYGHAVEEDECITPEPGYSPRPWWEAEGNALPLTL